MFLLTYRRNFPIFALSKSEFKKTALIEAINQLIGSEKKIYQTVY